MRDENCGYCVRGELLAPIGKYICTLGISDLILCREQSYPGHCIVSCREHVSELTDLTDEQRNTFFCDVARAAGALHAAFQPDKVNYGAFDDEGEHLCFHLVPKYQDGLDWGGVFQLDPGKKYLTDEEYTVLAEMIKAYL